ncbi:MAG: protein-L-isoaspartate(D-aspartate) O-methyltransferase [Bacteroidetes bacterium]|nr:protein-L-isoaspartate(D-aspartate) O-methyltransferase [Bacteroidota bacterium]
MEDSFRHQGMRRRMVEGLRAKGIVNEPVLQAINKVPRHAFMDTAFLEMAYEDRAFPIAADQTISQPYTVAYQTSLLDIKRGDKILEIGTGSGYQACVLLEMGARVFTIERQRELFDKTSKLLAALKYKPKMFFGDGFKGLPVDAPFDKIIITCGAPFIPPLLVQQVKIGGWMVIPLGEKEQRMTIVLRTSEDDFETREFDMFKFVPMLPDKVKNQLK